MNNRFTQKAQNTLNNALRFAAEMGHTYIGSEHILLALAAETDSVSGKLLADKGVTVEKLREEIAAVAGLGNAGSVSPRGYDPTHQADHRGLGYGGCPRRTELYRHRASAAFPAF